MKSFHSIFIILIIFILTPIISTNGCTGISLKAKDGSVVVGRTVEWALSDAQHYKIAIFPRGNRFSSLTPDGENGMKWNGIYGFVSLTAYGQNYGPDGMNEKGLYVGMYYLPGFAEYLQYDPKFADKSLSIGDFMQWVLSSFESIEQVKKSINDVKIINVEDARFGGAALPFHVKISDPSGKSIIIEIVNGGQVVIYDSFLGVITNSPTYDWHLLNLRNYLHLTPNPRQPISVDNLSLSPLGSGSGMIGLPGDFTPPSRFIRAAAFTASVRPLSDALDATFEAFRILDNFNIPLGATVPAANIPKDIEGATQITSVSDLTNKVYYYHTMFNREVRKIDLNKIDFSKIKQQIIDDDSGIKNLVKEVFVK